MKIVEKEIYLDLVSCLEPYGFKLYKGRIWKYEPSIGCVISLEVDSTRWGTLNDIILYVATCQEPIRINETRKANGFYFKICLRLGMFVRIHEKKNVITWDNPYDKADVVMKKQYEALRPYIQQYIYPLLSFDNEEKKYLANIEKIYQMDCETYIGETGIRWLDLAFEAFRLDGVESAIHIIDLNTVLCEKMIEKYKKQSADSTRWWMQEKQKAIDLANKIKTEPDLIRGIVEENRIISHNSCQQFFASRFFCG
ncbi:MAG: hypothetical protein IJK71_10645 [Clostridia bacterium]|nr:hypothetical protein [Clostridia bacterium]